MFCSSFSCNMHAHGAEWICNSPCIFEARAPGPPSKSYGNWSLSEVIPDCTADPLAPWPNDLLVSWPNDLLVSRPDDLLVGWPDDLLVLWGSLKLSKLIWPQFWHLGAFLPKLVYPSGIARRPRSNSIVSFLREALLMKIFFFSQTVASHTKIEE